MLHGMVMERRARQEEIVIHECAQHFPPEDLCRYLGCTHDVHSLVVSPTHVGVPATRERRITLMLKRQILSLVVPYSPEGFGGLFWNNVEMDGDIFYCAEQDAIASHVSKVACQHGFISDEVSPRGSLDAGRYMRLVGYEEAASHLVHAGSYVRCVISNLDQNVERMGALPSLMSCLLTRGVLWSHRHARYLIPQEHLVVMGIPAFEWLARDTGKECSIQTWLEECEDDGFLKHIAGNGMHLQVASENLNTKRAKKHALYVLLV